MVSQSVFQQQFPLSRKKFLKKFISQTPFAFFIIIFAFPVFYFLGSAYQMMEFDLRQFLMIIAAIVVSIMLLVVIIYAIYLKAYIRRYYYDSNENFITIRKGVFTPVEIHVQYQKIQDVYVDQDILDRIFGIYDVHLSSTTYASGIEAHIDGVDAPVAEGLKSHILGRINGAASGQISSEATPVVAQPPEITVNLTEEISSRTFPISGKYFFVAIYAAIFLSIILTCVVAFFIIGADKTNLPASALAAEKWSYYYNHYGGWLILAFFVCLIFNIIRTSIWIKKYFFALQKDFILQTAGVIAMSERHLPYRSIQDVQLKQSFMDRILGIGNVVIENAAGITAVGSPQNKNATVSDNGIDIPGQPIEKAQELVEKINDILRQQKNNSSAGL